VALAIVVALAFQRRVDFRPGTVGSSDPKALIETIDFNKTRVNRDKEEVRIQAGVDARLCQRARRGRGRSPTKTGCRAR
jgi:hypothetical protein